MACNVWDCPSVLSLNDTLNMFLAETKITNILILLQVSCMDEQNLSQNIILKLKVVTKI